MPHCVLLLDEIEKAHPDIYNILLQVMDYGKLTDNNGKVIDFRNVVMIMTTNAGATELARAPVGFEREVRVDEDIEAINKMFTPEFRNRLDAIVPFKALKQETVSKVVDKFMAQLEAQLTEKNVTIQLTDKARDYLAKEGYDPAMGARPLGRVIQEKIKKPLAEELLFGDLVNGGVVKIDSDKKEGLSFKIESASAPQEKLQEKKSKPTDKETVESRKNIRCLLSYPLRKN